MNIRNYYKIVAKHRGMCTQPAAPSLNHLIFSRRTLTGLPIDVIPLLSEKITPKCFQFDLFSIKVLFSMVYRRLRRQ